MGGAVELVDFLRARLDEDEAATRACPGNGEWAAEDIGIYGAELSPEVRAHMARHDPARVLAETEAKRMLLDDYERAWNACAKLSRGGIDMADVEEWKRQDQTVQTLKPHLLRQARIHRAHPDFDPDWLED